MAETEATLDEILDEPIVRLLMERDRVSEGEVRTLIRDTSPLLSLFLFAA
ncbi:hypothetical protein [Nitrospirillum iridis]|uniref:Uncharacterized protein n=1 Tax=Nitrospirillum iridis TaxID=765888 RepID=A0A7X0AVL6_9PROT|nr:hypothetical protein [Nitrospirillum iridis]MBB6249486.1 hypothetical protein [Nitrospirillum iridis]